VAVDMIVLVVMLEGLSLVVVAVPEDFAVVEAGRDVISMLFEAIKKIKYELINSRFKKEFLKKDPPFLFLLPQRCFE
jgi:hypothetical protein